MPRRDPRGAKRRFHVWLYEDDIEVVREHYARRGLSVNEVLRTQFHHLSNRIRDARQRVIDAGEPLPDVELSQPNV